MTPKQYQDAAIGLCRQFKPITDKPADHSHEFTFSGWRVHLYFAYRSEFKTKHGDWIHIGINDPHNVPPFCDHWKWNIHYSGSAEQVREALELELLRRLEMLAAHYDHTAAPAGKTKITFELPATAAQKITGFPVESVSTRTP